MTGIYIRVQRAGKWENLEIDQLTDDELDAVALHQPSRGWFWAKGLARWIRENVKETVETMKVPVGHESSTGQVEHCPQCKAPLDGFRGIGTDADIRSGNTFVLCSECGTWLVYDASRVMRLPTPAETVFLDAHPWNKAAAEAVIKKYQENRKLEDN